MPGKRLFYVDVEIRFPMLVLADSRDDALRVADVNHDDAFNSLNLEPTFNVCVEVERQEQLLAEDGDSIPYGEMDADMLCALDDEAEASEVAEFIERRNQRERDQQPAKGQRTFGIEE